MIATYNADAQLISRNDPAGAHTFTYDTLGRLATAYDPLSTRTLNYAYNDAYQITKATYGPNGTSAFRDYGYDNIGRLTSTTMKKSNNATTATETYTYDADDNLTNQQVLFPGASQTNNNQGTSDYTYDAAGRLTRQKRVSSTNGTTTVADYQWDPTGNRTAVFTNAAAQNWTYDQRNRIINGPDGTYTWDPRGTLDKIMSGATTVADLSFDNFGRLTSLTKSGSTINYTYDALDRIYQRAGASFAYNGTSIDPSLAAGVKYSRSPGERILSVQNGATTALAGINRHGDLRWLMNNTGDLTDTALYDPFGKTLETTGTTGANVGFQADYTDPLSTDVWMGARWYSPNDASFRSRDTITGQLSTPISLNRYTYAAANPLTFYDPDGHYYETYCDEWVGCYDYWVDDPVYYDYSYVDPCAWGGCYDYSYVDPCAWGGCYDYSYVDPCAWGGCDYNPPPEPYYDPCAWGGCYDYYYDPAPAPPPEPAPVYDPCAYDMWACIAWVMPEPVYTANYEAADTWSETVYRADEIDYTWAAVEAGFNPSYSAEAEQAYWDNQAAMNAASIDAFGYSIYDAAEITDAAWDAYYIAQQQQNLAVAYIEAMDDMGVWHENDIACEISLQCGDWENGHVNTFKDPDYSFLKFMGEAVSVVPVIGDIADAGRGLYNLAQGDWGDAALYGAGIVPIPGVSGATLKAGREGASYIDEAVGAACSFSGETEVLLADGTSKPISEIQVGDEVLATDPELGIEGPRKVTHVWVHQDTLYTLQTDAGDITTTEDHPFWNITDQQWQQAQQLEPGDELLSRDGMRTRVTGGIKWVSARSGTAYNLTVDGLHTYYVGVESKHVLVHNVDGCEIVAKRIQQKIGGVVEQVGDISNKYPLGSNHPLDDAAPWYYHQFVVKDGLAFDAFADGMPLDDYMSTYFPDWTLSPFVHL